MQAQRPALPDEVLRAAAPAACSMNWPSCSGSRTIRGGAGWNLINEPRCSGCGTGPLQAWLEEMAPFVKALDGNHLVSIGEEGFYARGAGNPGGATSCARRPRVQQRLRQPLRRVSEKGSSAAGLLGGAWS